ncbi:26S proteasome complex subunit [Cymbomonas tetramitiformis]|uniref:26S proteasome complex subunit SEM1 n=1 Tax=Cymbomonas tetramitiformis TaxID=36881 RepID=A0AAE0G114_9CHLO|nr:26S proteasome complex subunit [Cymbomonas tetramitiformis]|eukprot:gene16178-19198_t
MDPKPVKEQELDALEEDDEFEEFASEEWGAGDEDQGEAPAWEDDWDDDDVIDDFSKQLRSELEKVAGGTVEA